MADGPPPFDWNKLFTKQNQPKLIVGAVAVLALIVIAAKLHVFPDSPFAPRGGTNAGGGGILSSLTDAGRGEPVALNPLSAGQCRTFAPDGWTITDTNPNGTVMTVVSGDGTMTAAYGGVGINSAVVRYSGQSPENVLQGIVNALAGETVQIAPNGQIGVYQIVTLQSASHGGYALYYRFDIPSDPGAFGVIMRIALVVGGDKHAIATAGSVAAAIRCQSIVIPQSSGHDTDRGTAHGAGTSEKCAGGGACDDSDLAGTYNAQLGTGWAHDSLGRNYNVDVTTDWVDNGPDGPGYYGNVGGTREKLQPGLE